MTITKQQIDAALEAYHNYFRSKEYADIDLKEAFRSAIEAAEQAAWQPIETAPSEIVNCGYEVIISGGTAPIKTFVGDRPESIRVKCRSATAYAVCGEPTGWALSNGTEMDSPPTHWRPLPDAPTDHVVDANGKDLK